MTRQRLQPNPTLARWSSAALVLAGVLLMGADASAHEVTVDPGAYDGQWRYGSSARFTGSQIIDLPDGDHLVTVGSLGSFVVNVDAAGAVSVYNGTSAVGGAGTLVFNTVDVAVDPGAFDGLWHVSRGEPSNYVQGVATATLVPGIGFNLRIGSIGSLAIYADALGNVTTDNPASAVGGAGSLTLNTVDVVVDPGAYDGLWHLSRGEPSSYVTGPTTATLVPDIGFSLRIGSVGAAVVFADEAGNVTVENGTSGVGGLGTLTFNTVEVAVDPGAYDGLWSLSRGEPGTHLVGPTTATLVPDIGFQVRVGSYGNFIVSADSGGSVTVANGVSGTGGVGALDFNTVDVAVDPGDYAGEWLVSRGDPLSFVTGPATATFVTGLAFGIRVGSLDFFQVQAQADGMIDVFNGESAAGGVETLAFNTVAVTIDPGTFPNAWSVSLASDDFVGPGTVDLVPGVDYNVAGGGIGVERLSVSDPCVVSPTSFDMADFAFTATCGCDDADADGICDSEDACPADADNDSDNDGVCGDLDQCSGNDAAGDSDGDFICDDVDLCFGDNTTGDSDSDGLCNDSDQCAGQDATGDADADGICDSDDACFGDDASGNLDGDLVCDDLDQCIGADASGDSDGDGTCDDSDACPLDELDDEDGDGVCGDLDACLGDDASGDDDLDDICNDQDLCAGNDVTGDEDGDGYCDDVDNCPIDANTDQADADLDAIGDLCEADGDMDGVIDDVDNCVDAPNDDQSDLDADGAGDPCDDDDDGDGVEDTDDNCPMLANTGQEDADADGAGDVCDGDDDADGVSDDNDLCPGTPLGVLYDEDGCSGLQLVDVMCGEPRDYNRPGPYMRCVVRASKVAQRRGLLSRRQRARIIRAAARGISSWRRRRCG